MSQGSRTDKVALFVKQIAAQVLEAESNKTSLITVTNCTVSDDFKSANVYITVLPRSGEESALNFAKRQRAEIRQKIKKSISMNRIPFIEFLIDTGEYNRQHIDDLLRHEPKGVEESEVEQTEEL